MKPKLLEATLGGGRLLKRKSSVLIVAAFGAAGLYGPSVPSLLLPLRRPSMRRMRATRR